MMNIENYTSQLLGPESGSGMTGYMRGDGDREGARKE